MGRSNREAIRCEERSSTTSKGCAVNGRLVTSRATRTGPGLHRPRCRDKGPWWRGWHRTTLSCACASERPFATRSPEGLHNLRLIVTTGPWNASIDGAAARKQGITVSGTGSLASVPAKLTWALILGLMRHLVEEVKDVRTGGVESSDVVFDGATASSGGCTLVARIRSRWTFGLLGDVLGGLGPDDGV